MMLFLLLIVSVRVYSDGFSVAVVDSEGIKYDLANAVCTYHTGQKWRAFHWFPSYRADSGFNLEFKDVKSINFVGKTNDVRLGFALAEVVFANENEAAFLVSTAGYLGGFDTLIGTYLRIPRDEIRSIVFVDDIVLKKCPTTGELFSDPEYLFSPYTGERLIPVE